VVVVAALWLATRGDPGTGSSSQPPGPTPTGPRPDLVLVTIDTLRFDAPGFAGGRATTPNLDQLAADGRVFTNAQAHNVVTLPSHANILTGLYPYQHGVRDNSGFVLPEDLPTLATVAREHGYATAAVVSAFPLDSRYGLDRGFGLYDDRLSTTGGEDAFAMAERRGDEAVAVARTWWAEQAASPRFLWLHLYDPHAPYEPPEPFRSRYRDRPYDGEVSAVDAFLGPLLADLRAPGPRPVFLALTADHGEALGDHGELTHGLFCYRSTLQVPLLLWGAGVTPGIDPRLARHVDLFPTLLAAAGLAEPPPGGERANTSSASFPADRARTGRSLLDPAAAEPVDSYFEALSAALNRGWAPLRGVIAGSTKAIALPLPELYDLARDPAEANNRFADERRRHRELIATLPHESAWPPARAAASDEELRRLGALGYLGGDAGAPTEPTPADDPKQLLDLDRQIFAAIEATRLGRGADAVRRAEAIVAARPSMPLGRTLLAQALLAAGRNGEAIAVMQRARSEGAATRTLLRQLALTLLEQGDHPTATAVLDPLVAEGDLDGRVIRAQALSDAGRQDEAAAELVAIAPQRPDDARVLEVTALVELRRGRFAAARAAALRSTELAPGNARAWNSLGVAAMQLGEVDPALAAWHRATELDPALWDAWWNLGVQSGRHGRLAEAKRALTAFAAGAPERRYAEDRRQARAMLATLPPG
jgi:choline-sulfatase